MWSSLRWPSIPQHSLPNTVRTAYFKWAQSGYYLISVALKAKWSKEPHFYSRSRSLWQRRLQTTTPHGGSVNTHTSNKPHKPPTNRMFIFSKEAAVKCLMTRFEATLNNSVVLNGNHVKYTVAVGGQRNAFAFPECMTARSGLFLAF